MALLAVLRGRRRKLCDMTLPDEELEYRLKGFRFCHWIERWRLACNVLTISLGTVRELGTCIMAHVWCRCGLRASESCKRRALACACWYGARRIALHARRFFDL